MFIRANATAADNINADVEAWRVYLEEKYAIDISYDRDPDGKACIGTGSMATLDMALEMVSAPVVRQVSAYYKEKLGKPLSYAFRYNPYYDPDSNLEILGSFDIESASIELYIPSASKGVFTTGDSPMTIVHEFAHALHFMLMDKTDAAQMEREWTALNGGVGYNTGFLAYAYNKLVFISSYGATDYREDFAEVFSQSLVRGRDGMGFYYKLQTGDERTPLGKKVDYLTALMPRYFADSGTVVTNFKKTATAQAQLYYKGVLLSGEHLQFMGCAYPRYVLNGILGLLELKADSQEWIQDIGGWQVKMTDGSYYLIFPGGYHERIVEPINTAA